MIKGGCVTTSGDPNANLITFSAGKQGTYLTIDREGVMHIGPDLSEDVATQRIAMMLVAAWGTAYGSRLRIAEDAIDGERVKAKRAQAEMERWRSAAMKAGVNAKTPKEKKLTAADLNEDDDACG